MKLYTYFRSSAAFRVRIALNLKGLAYEPLFVHLAKGEHRKPEYAAVNPQALLPTLVLDDGARLTQSLAIMEYLEEKHPQPALLPKDALGRARVRSLANLIASEIHPLNNLRTLQHPLLALLLIIAGSLVEWTAIVLWVTGYIVVLRFAAKLLASIVAARLARVSPVLLSIVLLQPGIMGIALGLNAGLILGDDANWIVSVVTMSVMVAEVLAAFLPRDRGEAS